MTVLLSSLISLSLVLFGVAYVFWRVEARIREAPPRDNPDLKVNFEALEVRFEQLKGEVIENLARATEQHRQASVKFAKARKLTESEEGEDEFQTALDLSGGNGEGGPGQGVQTVPDDLAGLPPHLQYAKLRAREMVRGS